MLDQEMIAETKTTGKIFKRPHEIGGKGSPFEGAFGTQQLEKDVTPYQW